jgi:hypothetical protein
MSIYLLQESPTVYRMDISGLLRRSEMERCEAELADEVRNGATVRLLVILEGFDGWSPGDNWSDLGFYVKHGNAIERIAIVGDEQWRGAALMFANADLRSAAVEFFPRRGIGIARAWLRE